MERWATTHDRWEVSESGQIRNKQTKKFLKTRLRKDGYIDVKLSYTRQLVHRLVAQAFLPNPNAYAQVNHIDGKRDNPHVSNLEWCDQFGNMKHALANGLFPSRKGTKNGRATISEETARKIKDLLAAGHGATWIARQIGTTHGIVNNIKRGFAWAWL